MERINYSFEEKKNKLKDIKNIDFGDNVNEIISTMEILLNFFKINDDPEIIGACKLRLKEGVLLLKDFGASDKARQFYV